MSWDDDWNAGQTSAEDAARAAADAASQSAADAAARAAEAAKKARQRQGGQGGQGKTSPTSTPQPTPVEEPSSGLSPEATTALVVVGSTLAVVLGAMAVEEFVLPRLRGR